MRILSPADSEFYLLLLESAKHVLLPRDGVSEDEVLVVLLDLRVEVLRGSICREGKRELIWSSIKGIHISIYSIERRIEIAHGSKLVDFGYCSTQLSSSDAAVYDLNLRDFASTLPHY